MNLSELSLTDLNAAYNLCETLVIYWTRQKSADNTKESRDNFNMFSEKLNLIRKEIEKRIKEMS